MTQELLRILDLHVQKYPQMTPRDLIKLIYQSEFGGGHLLSDFDRCSTRIQEEYKATPQQNVPLYEDIGFGFVRLQLQGLDASGLTVEEAAKIFYNSASVSYGSEESFMQKLSILPSLIDSRFSFTREELQSFLSEYISSGCGMLSHSALYRERYSPAYRVIYR